MLTDEEVKAFLLHKLARLGKFGHAHTSFDNLPKGFDQRDLGGKGDKRIKQLAKELIRQGWLLQKPTHYGIEVFLNTQNAQEIKSFIKEQIGIDLE